MPQAVLHYFKEYFNLQITLFLVVIVRMLIDPSFGITCTSLDPFLVSGLKMALKEYKVPFFIFLFSPKISYVFGH